MMDIILIGAGGHAKVLLDIFSSETTNVIGYVNTIKQDSAEFSQLSYLGSDADIDYENFSTCKVANGIGINKDLITRKKIFDLYKIKGFRFITLVHPNAIVSKRSNVLEGVQVFTNAIVQASSIIGENTIINTGAIIEHDASIGAHCHIASGAIVTGGVYIEDSVFVGAGAVVLPNCKIVSKTIIGAGAVVCKNIIEPGVYAGNPAHKIK